MVLLNVSNRVWINHCELQAMAQTSRMAEQLELSDKSDDMDLVYGITLDDESEL